MRPIAALGLGLGWLGAVGAAWAASGIASVQPTGSQPAVSQPATSQPTGSQPTASQLAAAAEPPPPARMSDAECAVWEREVSFARSLAEHDAKGFAAHLHPQAAFGAGRPQPARGRDAIAAQWAELIEGKHLRLRWYPTRVTIGGAGDVAWSTGPALYERLQPGAQPRYLIGAFQSVWQRGADGIWLTVFDDGQSPRPATEAEAMAFERDRRAECPRR